MYYPVDDTMPAQPPRSLTIAQATPTRLCIVGGGFGGLYTALSLRKLAKRSPNLQITLVEPRENFVFTPLLYEVVTGELHPWEVAPTYCNLLKGSAIQLWKGRVQRVDLDARQVIVEGGKTLDYDYLVLASGSENRLDWVPGAATHAQTFRNLSDAERLKERLRFLESSGRPIIRVAVAGGGPNGVEIACKLADRLRHRADVRLIERGDQILKAFTPGSRQLATRALRQRGVQVQLNTSITAIESEQITLNHQGNVQAFPVDLVLWTAGTQIADWVRELPCQHNDYGQLHLLPTLQLAEYPEVFALGDLTELHNPGGRRVPATAQAAYQQASCAAQNLQRAISGRPLLKFRYLHLGEMMTLGFQSAVVSSFGITLGGWLAQEVRRWVYAQRLPTLHHRLQVMAGWIRDGFLNLFPKSPRSRSKLMGKRPHYRPAR